MSVPGLEGSRVPFTKSVNRSEGPEPSDSYLRDNLISIDEETDYKIVNVVKEFIKEYPQLAELPVSTGGGMRDEYVEYVERTWNVEEYKHGKLESTEVSEWRPDRAVCWADALAMTLERYQRAIGTTLEFGGPDGEVFWDQGSNRWSEDYQSEQFAQLQGFVRRLAGGSYESVSGVADEEVVGEYESPKLVMLTRSASSVPDGERRAPVDHARQLSESWSRDSGGDVYGTLRNRLRGLVEAWEYDARAEVHPGKGHALNACYGHEHVAVLVDAPGVSRGELRAEMRDVIEKHVEETEWAGREAHDLDKSEAEWADPSVPVETVKVFDEGELDDAAAYVAGYVSIDGDAGLFDRSVEFQAWAAAFDAGNFRTKRRSEGAREAAGEDLERIKALKSGAAEIRSGEYVERTDAEVVDLDGVGSDGGDVGGGGGVDSEAVESGAEAFGGGGEGDGLDTVTTWVGGGDSEAVASAAEPVRSDYLADVIRSRFGGIERSREACERVVEELRADGWDLSRSAVRAGLMSRGMYEGLDGSRQISAALREYIQEHFIGEGMDAGAVRAELEKRGFVVDVETVAASIGLDVGSVERSWRCEGEGSAWELVAVYDPSGEARRPGGGTVEMVEVETSIDEYRGLFTAAPWRSVSDVLGEESGWWRDRDGTAFGGSLMDAVEWAELMGADGMGELFEYVRPHVAGWESPWTESGWERHSDLLAAGESEDSGGSGGSDDVPVIEAGGPGGAGGGRVGAVADD